MTTGPGGHNHAYPTCRTWTRDGRRILIESHDPPAIESIDIETLKIERVAKCSGGCYGFDYAPGVDSLVSIDDGGHSLKLVNLTSGRTGVIHEEPEGTICGPPSISSCGTRVVYWSTWPTVANRFFDDYVTAIFAMDVDPGRCEAVREPWIVESYPRRKGKDWDRNPRAGIHVNHPQVNPADRDHICYSHEMLGATPDGSVDMCRLWQVMADGSDNRFLVRQPAGLHFTHEVIAPDGRSLIFPYMHGVGQVDFGTLAHRSIYYNPDCCPGHLTVSPDLAWIAGDTWGDRKEEAGSPIQSIMMFETATRRFAHLCWFPRSHGHPTHPHPNFSPDGSRVAFAMLVDDTCQVACIDVREVQSRWDDVAEGVGELGTAL